MTFFSPGESSFYRHFQPRSGWERLSIDHLVKLEIFDYRCAYCLEPLENVRTSAWHRRPDLFRSRACQWDHVVARGCGADDDPDNYVPACAECNAKKNDKLVAVWYCGSTLRVKSMPVPPAGASLTDAQINEGLRIYAVAKNKRFDAVQASESFRLVDYYVRNWFFKYLRWLNYQPR